MASLQCGVALKEWAVIVDALAAGDQLVLLRKGGIHDLGGEFRLEADSFLLWPTYEHQEAAWLRPEQAGRIERALAARPAGRKVALRCHAEVVDILVVPDRACLDELGREHLWSSAYLDTRWRYRPELPLYALTLRTMLLPRPVELLEQAHHRGCRSWVDVEPSVDLEGLRPVLDDETFERRAEWVRAQLNNLAA